MNALWEAADFWPVRMLVAGGVVLLAGRLTMMAVRQPARRAIVGICAVFAALLLVPISLMPGWISIPVPKAPEQSLVENSVTPPHQPAGQAVVPQDWALVIWIPDEGRADVPAVEPARGLPVEIAPAAVEQIASEPPSPPARWELQDYLVLGSIFYLGLGVLLLTRLWVGHFALGRLWRNAHGVPDWAEHVFRHLAANTCPTARLRMTYRKVGPVCFGVFRPRVLVPASLLTSGDGPALRCILAHELGHLSRRDPLIGWLLGLAHAIYFPCPGFGSLRREIRVAQECLADAEAKELAEAPVDYAELLLRLTRTRPAPLGAAGARGSNSELFRRITMLLQKSEPVERRCPRRWLVACGGGLTALAVFAGGLTLKARTAEAAEPEKKEAAKPKPAVKTDPLKEAIEKLKKDVGDDPEAAKKLEELLKSLEKRDPSPVPPGLVPPRDAPEPLGPMDPFSKEFQKMQDDLRKQMEQIMGQLQGAGVRGGFMLRPGGGLQPFPGLGGQGGGRLGVRVERPSDALISQLDLPNGKGLLVTDVPADSTAGKLGMKPHDILLEVAGKSVPSQVAEFVQELKSVKETDAIDIVLLRKGKKETLKSVKLPAAKEVLVDPHAPLLPQLPDFNVVPLPLPMPPAGNARPAPAGPFVPPALQIAEGESVRVEQVNDAFTIFYSKNKVKVTVTGAKDADGKPVAESIEVEDAGKTTKAESIEKLPKEYQELAKKALGSIK